MLVSLGMHSSKTNGNGACCTYEQEMGYAVHMSRWRKAESETKFWNI